MSTFLSLPEATHYWLRNGRLPVAFEKGAFTESPVVAQLLSSEQGDGGIAVDIEICDGKIISLRPTAADNTSDIPAVDVGAGLIWPCFVDVHTHLDKGHIWPRSPNPDGTFARALAAVAQDSQQHWEWADVYRRMDFGLRCSYAHGTQAIRTHLDAFGAQGEISFQVFGQLQKEWADKILLQAACLVTLDCLMGKAGERLADLVASCGGVLGGVAFMNPEIKQQIDRAFVLAKERNLDLDFHTDESLNPDDMALRYVAEAALRHDFPGRITCGHCCSLSVQSEEVVRETITLVQVADISIVSLPMCNLYLQGREPAKTPRYRGVTVLHELKAAGVKVALASDNCRDPFFAYGDHDGLEVFTQAARIGHLDHPIGDWPQAVTSVPAKMMGLDSIGQIGEGLSADLVVFQARNFNELMARGQGDRLVIRKGKQIDTTLPDYAELDDLMM